MHWNSGENKNVEAVNLKLKSFSDELQATLEGKFEECYQVITTSHEELVKNKEDIHNLRK